MDNLKLRPASGLLALSFLCVGMSYSQTANAAIYTYVEKDGTRWLTNTPKQGKQYKLVAKYGAPQAKPNTTYAANAMNLNTIRVPTAFNSNYAAAGIPRMHCGGLSYDQMERRLEPHLPSLQTFARTYGVEENFVRAVMKQESCFNSRALSSAGAIGLMQWMPGTADLMGVNDAWDPHQNIKGGVKYLSQMLREFNGNKALALAAYNAGPGAVKKYSGIPPYRETQNYVSRIMAEYQRLETRSVSNTVATGFQRSSRVYNGAAPYAWAKPVQEFSVFKALDRN